jgi:hypothetical protein
MGKEKKNKVVKGIDERALFVFEKVRSLLNLPSEISSKKKKFKINILAEKFKIGTITFKVLDNSSIELLSSDGVFAVPGVGKAIKILLKEIRKTARVLEIANKKELKAKGKIEKVTKKKEVDPKKAIAKEAKAEAKAKRKAEKEAKKVARVEAKKAKTESKVAKKKENKKKPAKKETEKKKLPAIPQAPEKENKKVKK